MVHSPYKSPVVTLCIGPEGAEYHIPQDLLQNPDWVASSYSGMTVKLPDVEESTGHVLVHYLHTGAYQTLNDVETSAAKEINIEFKRAISVYTAAHSYGLHGLQQLAKGKVEQLGAEMSITEVIETIDNDFSKLPSDAAWFHDFLHQKAKATFEENRTTFRDNDFFDHITDIALARILVKYVVGLYEDKVSCMLPKPAPEPEPEPEPEPVAEESPVSMVTPEPIAKEPPVSMVTPVESPDDNGWGLSSWTSSKKKNNVKIAFEDPLPSNPELIIEEASSYDEWGGYTFGTKKKGKRQSAIEEPSLHPPPEPEPEPESTDKIPIAEDWDSWGFGFGSKKKKGKKIEFVQISKVEPEVEPAPVVECNVTDELGAKNNICPARAKHLLEGDGWRNCNQCRALLGQVAIQLVRSGPVDETGHGIVDQMLMN